MYEALHITAEHVLADAARISSSLLRQWCLRNAAKGNALFRLIDTDWAQLQRHGITSRVTAMRYALSLEILLNRKFLKTSLLRMEAQRTEEATKNENETAVMLCALAILRRTGVSCTLLDSGAIAIDGRLGPLHAADGFLSRTCLSRLAASLEGHPELPTAILSMDHGDERGNAGEMELQQDPLKGPHAILRLTPFMLLSAASNVTVLHELHHWRWCRDLVRDLRHMPHRPNELRRRYLILGRTAMPPWLVDTTDDLLASMRTHYLRTHRLDEIPAYHLSARKWLREAHCQGDAETRAIDLREGYRSITLAHDLWMNDLSVLLAVVEALRTGKAKIRRVKYLASAADHVMRPDRVILLEGGERVWFFSAQFRREQPEGDAQDGPLRPTAVGAILDTVIEALQKLKPHMTRTRMAFEALLKSAEAVP